MARLPRFSPAGLPALVLQRGNNRQPVFLRPDDYRFYLDCLRMAAREHDVALHAYGLRPDHIHLLATPRDEDGLSLTMQAVGRRYARYFNREARRTGTLWEGRFRSAVIDPQHWVLPAMLYVEGNAVRAGEATALDQDPWTSYGHHIGLTPSPFVSDHSAYWALGNTPFERQSRYQALSAEGLSGSTLMQLRRHAHSGWPLGDTAFLASLERGASRRVRPLAKGRPKGSSKAVTGGADADA